MAALSRRLKILEALAKASEANAEAMRLLLDGESIPPPPMEKVQAAPPVARPTRLVPAFTAERAAEEVRKAWAEAKTEADRAKVIDTAGRLVSQGLLSSEEMDSLFKT